MKEHPPYSDEQLQAFIDDEIDVAERAEIMEAIQDDDELACRVCELAQVKDLVKLAYREHAHSSHNRQHLPVPWHARLPQAAAALLVFALGTGTGLLWTNQAGTGIPGGEQLLAGISAQQQEQKRVIFHISTDDTRRLNQALDDAEELLASYRDHPERVQLEVVANATGLSLLRTDTSPFPERIRRLTELYDNISFLACSRSIEKLHLRGIDVHLLPEAQLIPAALDEIVDRLQEGWVYIRV